MQNDDTLLLSGRDAARLLAVSERTLFTLTREGRVNAVRIGARCVRYDRRDLEKFIQKCKGGRYDTKVL